jgi:type IV secretory pathway TraG/TraD family ATPase VirD4
MRIVEKLLADAAGYGAKFYLIAQSDKQINKAYEKENSIFAGCQHKVMYRPADQDTAKSLSELLGNYTYIEKTVNVSDGDTGKIDILKSKSASKSWNESSRALMTQDEIMSMEDDEAIILSKSHKIFGRKLRYYLDPYLSTITKIKAPELQMKPIITDEETFKKRMQVKGIDINQKISEYKEHLENTKNPQKSTSETNEMYDKSNLTD